MQEDLTRQKQPQESSKGSPQEPKETKSGRGPSDALSPDASGLSGRGASAPLSSFPPFAFDAPYRDVAIDATPGRRPPKVVYHRLARPTKDQTYAHQIAQASETVFHGGESQTTKTAGSTPDFDLWQKIIKQTKGYNFHDGTKASEWTEVSPARLEAIPSQHAHEAMTGYYNCSVTLIEDEEEDSEDGEESGFSVNNGPLRFRMEIGPDDAPEFVLVWTAKRSDNEARKRFEADRGTSRQQGTGKGAKTYNTLNYKAYQEYLRALTLDFENATASGGKTYGQVRGNAKQRQEWFSWIEDFWALELIGAYNKAFKAASLGLRTP